MKKFLIALSFLALLLLGYQNCSNVKLAPYPMASSTSVQAKICSIPPAGNKNQPNIIFIVDMSGSNVEGTGGAQPTDLAGKRFDIIDQFLSNGCGGAIPANTRYSVFGFSANVGIFTGKNTGDKTDFKTLSQARADNEKLRQLQIADIPLPSGWKMTTTVYSSAFQYLSEMITDDLNGLSDDEKLSKVYTVFFLSDGGPTNADGSVQYHDINSAGVSAVLNRLNDLTDVISGFTVQPILYGADQLAPQEKPYAINIINGIAALGNGIPDITVDDVTKINFCELLKNKRKIPYVITSFGIVNLNATVKNGKLLADSDADGIPDIYETQYGFDPLQPRSLAKDGVYLIDGFCKASNSQLSSSQCKAQYPQYTQAYCGIPDGTGLTKCERQTFGLLNSLDSDLDGIPDLIEVLKSTNPAIFDINLDLDGDGITNLQEIQSGRDPNTSDTNLPSEYTINYDFRLSTTPSDTCPDPQQSWDLNVSHIPLVSTYAINTSQSPLDSVSSQVEYYSHDANQNVLFVYFITKKKNTAKGEGVLYGQYIKTVRNFALNPDNFKRLGVVLGK